MWSHFVPTVCVQMASEQTKLPALSSKRASIRYEVFLDSSLLADSSPLSPVVVIFLNSSTAVVIFMNYFDRRRSSFVDQQIAGLEVHCPCCNKVQTLGQGGNSLRVHLDKCPKQTVACAACKDSGSNETHSMITSPTSVVNVSSVASGAKNK